MSVKDAPTRHGDKTRCTAESPPSGPGPGPKGLVPPVWRPDRELTAAHSKNSPLPPPVKKHPPWCADLTGSVAGLLSQYSHSIWHFENAKCWTPTLRPHPRPGPNGSCFPLRAPCRSASLQTLNPLHPAYVVCSHRNAFRARARSNTWHPLARFFHFQSG